MYETEDEYRTIDSFNEQLFVEYLVEEAGKLMTNSKVVLSKEKTKYRQMVEYISLFEECNKKFIQTLEILKDIQHS